MFTLSASGRSFALAAAITAVLSVGPGGPARAQTADPAIAPIDALDASLIETMKKAKDLGVMGRYRKLDPVVRRTFDLPVMARYAVGARWADFTDAERQNVIDAFSRLTIASYAHNFDGYGGERFEITPEVQTRNQDKIVQTRLVRTMDKPVALNYRMRLSDGSWKVIDVYYGTISQLTIRRADLAATAMNGGAKVLTKNMNNQADKLLR